MAERLTDEDLDGIARFGVAMESDQQAMAAELLELRQKVRALVEMDADSHPGLSAEKYGCGCEACRALAALRALVKGE